MNKIIEMNHLQFVYEDGTCALKNICFDVEQGQVILLVGRSGCGKSTLLNILNGIIPEIIEGDLQGELIIDGQKNTKLYQRSKIFGNVFQNPRSQFFTNNTTSEMVFAMENHGFSYKEMKQRLEEVVEEYQIQSLLNRNIFHLSSGQRQLLTLLSSLMMKPKVLIFDEPSANLDYGNAMRLKKQMLRLKQEGKTIFIADHRYYYLDGIVDKVLLIEDKQLFTFDTLSDFMASPYCKRTFYLFDDRYPKKDIYKGNQMMIEVKGLGYKHILQDLHIKFYKYEVTTLIGVNGVGKTTFARLLLKLLKPDHGSITTNHRMLYVMQDADFQLFGSSVLKELEITSKNHKKNEEALKLLNLWHLKDHHPQTLSGGEKQRLQLALCFVCQEEILILDEPTSGLDKESMEHVLDMLQLLKKEKTIILISHDYEFIRKISDRIVYLSNQSIKEDFYLEENHIETLNTIYKEMENYYE